MKYPVKLLPLATALALAAGQAQALGLGALEVKSQLNQPLVAEIPLIGVAPGELDALSVRLAPPEAFERVGLPRPAGVTANLQFSVGRNARGEPVVRVTTSNRVDDPFVSFLLEADWGRGSVVREFTALIDPPHIAAATVTPMAPATVAAAPAAPRPAPVPETSAPVAAAAPAAAEPLPAPPPARPAPPAARPAPAPAPAAPPSAPAAAPGQRVVQEGETLWRIASETRQGVSVAQMMLAIQRANPEAFIGNNINQMRRGAVLRIPTAAEAQDLSREAAEAQVREQMAAWRGGSTVPTPVPAETPAMAAAPAQARSPSRPAPSSTGTGPRLEIAPPAGGGQAGAQSGAAAGGSGSELRAELQQLREDLSARDAEIRELRSRLAEQEALASDQQRLLQLKDSQLSAMEEALRRQREGEPAAAEAVAPAVPAEGGPAEGVADTAPAVPAPPATAPAGPPAAPAADSAAAPAATAPEPATPWYQQPLVLGAGGLVLVGGLLALLLRRRSAPVAKPVLPAAAAGAGSRGRLSEDAEFLSKLAPSPAPVPGAEDGEGDVTRVRPAVGLPAAEDAPDTDRTGQAPAEAAPLAGITQVMPVVPPAEAPGSAPGPSATSRDPVRAELERRIAANPADLETHVALLRQHYNAGDAEAFLAAAEAMRPQVGEPGDPRWREVVVMGMGLLPGHALFREVRWNPVNAADVRTRNDAPSATPAPPVAPSAPSASAGEDFDAEITAQRPAVSLPEPEAADMDDTRLELAKAYIEIGDAEGARGMLEEVLAEGGAAARAEAERLLKQLG